MTVSYEVAKPFDSGEVIRLLAGGFSKSEPPAVAMGLSMEESSNSSTRSRSLSFRRNSHSLHAASTQEGWLEFC